jgi:hypothetical protein
VALPGVHQLEVTVPLIERWCARMRGFARASSLGKEYSLVVEEEQGLSLWSGEFNAEAVLHSISNWSAVLLTASSTAQCLHNLNWHLAGLQAIRLDPMSYEVAAHAVFSAYLINARTLSGDLYEYARQGPECTDCLAGGASWAEVVLGVVGYGLMCFHVRTQGLGVARACTYQQSICRSTTCLWMDLACMRQRSRRFSKGNPVTP